MNPAQFVNLQQDRRQFVDPRQEEMFDPITDIQNFIVRCFNDDGVIHMRRRLPNPGCDILLVYNKTENHANQYRGNDFMHVVFKYPSTIADHLIKPMMEDALVRHQYLLCQMRRWCDINRIVVVQRQNNYFDAITTTRIMRSKYDANKHRVFEDRLGWGVSTVDCTHQLYQPLHFNANGYPLGHF
jgi:hypothetical protein